MKKRTNEQKKKTQQMNDKGKGKNGDEASFFLTSSIVSFKDLESAPTASF